MLNYIICKNIRKYFYLLLLSQKCFANRRYHWHRIWWFFAELAARSLLAHKGLPDETIARKSTDFQPAIICFHTHQCQTRKNQQIKETSQKFSSSIFWYRSYLPILAILYYPVHADYLQKQGVLACIERERIDLQFLKMRKGQNIKEQVSEFAYEIERPVLICAGWANKLFLLGKKYQNNSTNFINLSFQMQGTQMSINETGFHFIFRNTHTHLFLSRTFTQIVIIKIFYMMLEDQDFFERFICSANVLFAADLNSNHCFSSNSENNNLLFFKCIKIPISQGFQIGQMKSNIDNALASGWNQLTKSQQVNSKHVLVYKKVVVSFPYVCLLHQPIIEYHLAQFSCVSGIVKKGLNYTQKINLMMNITMAIEELHSKRICLRSLTTENIVITDQTEDEFEILFSQIDDFLQLGENGRVNEVVKQITDFSAPQLVQLKAHSLSCDIWSLGVIFYRILFQKCFDVDALIQKQNSNNCFPVGTPIWIPNFIFKMTHENPLKRHLIRDVIDILKKAQLCSEAACKFFKCK